LQIRDQSSNNIFSVKRDVTTFGTSIVGNGTGVVFPTGYVYGQFGDSGGNGRFDLNTTIGLGLEASGQVVWSSSYAGTSGDAGVSRDAGENGKIDEFGAEEILKEMYEEVQFRPEIIKAHK
jgi:hypothetical protein